MNSDLNIVKSAAALRMLQMVTAGFYDNSRLALWIFETIGREWDAMSEWAKNVHTEIFPQTCSWSIETWEDLYAIETDTSLTLEQRRQRLMAKALYAAPINPEVIRRRVAALTGSEDVTVEEHTAPYTFEVTVKHSVHIPNQGAVWLYIYGIKPSHLSFRLFFVMETPVYHELNAGLLGASVTEKEIEEIPTEHIVDHTINLAGEHQTIVEVRVEEIVAQREIAKIVQLAGVGQPVEEKTIPVIETEHKVDGTVKLAGQAQRTTETTVAEIEPKHEPNTELAAVGAAAPVQETTVREVTPERTATATVTTGGAASGFVETTLQEIPPEPKKAAEANVGGAVLAVEERELPEYEQIMLDFDLHTNKQVQEIVEITLNNEKEDKKE